MQLITTRQAGLSSIPVANASRVYPLSETLNEADSRWTMCKNPVCFKPDADHQWMMDMVAEGLDAKIFYTSCMLEFIERRLANQLPSDYKSRGTTRVEGGVLGMEVYYARLAVEAKREHAAQMDAASKIRIGDEIKQAEIRVDGKTSKWNGVVQEINSEYGGVKLSASRRGDKKRYIITIPASHNALSTIVKARTEVPREETSTDGIASSSPSFQLPAQNPGGQHSLSF